MDDKNLTNLVGIAEQLYAFVENMKKDLPDDINEQLEEACKKSKVDIEEMKKTILNQAKPKRK